MSNIVIGWDQGSYTCNEGTRQITLSGLQFTPTITGLLYVHNYTQKKTYFAQAQSYDKSITFTADGDDWIMEYQNLSTFPVLGANDVIHIQFDSINNADNPTYVTIEEIGDDVSFDGNSSIVDAETDKAVDVESLGALKTIIPQRLCGTAFSNGTKDTNFWTEVTTGTGSVTQNGEITLATGTTANSTASYTTVRKARKVTGRTNQFRAVARNVQEPTADCIRRIGCYNSNDGFFMQHDGTTFGLASRKGGVDTIVTNGNFNGNAGDTIDATGTSFIRVVIEYTSLSAKFFFNGVLIHTIRATTSALTTSQDLPVTIELNNENGNVTDNSFEVLFATILGLGEIVTESAYKFIGTNATTICKYGAGRLRRILNVDNAGTTTVYDNTAASGTQIAVIDTAKALGTLDFDIPFNNGLTVVTATGAKVVIVYE